MPNATARCFPDQASETRMVVVTRTPPTPKPDKNRNIVTHSQEGATAVSTVNKPKKAVDKITDLDLPSLSHRRPQDTPPNIHPKIKTELIAALTSFNLSVVASPSSSFTATGKYTDIRVLTTPPSMLLIKQIANNRRL